ncbi:metallophosphoesterase family protein [Capilliphycus salinus ALCB114379]|uniref:metallophosphoesterase family protein n=1 Tax=Capilliphycus salinus TaxID=2768948 RepID=UPI0039A40714
MKIIHTADLHLGRTIGDEKKSRNEEINYALNQILDRVSSGDIDAVLIAGDIFDKAKPSNESLLVFKSFTVELVRLNTPVVAIAGNHDSPSLIDTETQLWRLFGSHIIGTERTAENGGLIRIQTRCGTDLIIGLLPFIRNTKLTNLGDIWSESNGISYSSYSAEMLKKIDELAQGFQADTVNILMYHGTLAGAKISGTERAHDSIEVYNIPGEQLPATAQYVALGHLHIPQQVKATVPAYYSGSLIQCDFGEAGEQKSFNLIEVEPHKTATVHQIPIRQLRELKQVHCQLETLEEELKNYSNFEGWLKVVVNLGGIRCPDLNQRVRSICPHAVIVVSEAINQSPQPVGVETEQFDLIQAYRDYLGEQPESRVQKFSQIYQEALALEV